MKNIVNLESGIVVPRADIVQASVSELNTFIATLTANTKPIRVVDNADTFFTVKNLDKSIDIADIQAIRMISEKRGMPITEDDLAHIAAFGEFKRSLTSRPAIVSAYKYADIPAKWSVESNLIITAKLIRRKNNRDYTMTPKSAETLWNYARDKWSEFPDAPGNVNIRAGGYNRTALIFNNRVEIGCQSVERYELEQLAIHMGWKLPE